MEEKNYTGLVPENKDGKEITAEASVTLANAEEAQSFYKIAHDRLFYVNNWGEIAGKLSADFQLTNEKGAEEDRFAQKGDHFRVDIPGPGSVAGKGYDWAHVEEVREFKTDEVESAAIMVRPASNPQTENQNIAHFYSEDSTSTFTVTREGNVVTASIYDRNIKANEETNQTIDKARNAIIGLSGKHGFSKIQWKALAEALIKKEE